MSMWIFLQFLSRVSEIQEKQQREEDKLKLEQESRARSMARRLAKSQTKWNSHFYWSYLTVSQQWDNNSLLFTLDFPKDPVNIITGIVLCKKHIYYICG